jgi:hypothetical protein
MWTGQVITVENSFMDLNAFSIKRSSIVKKKDFHMQLTVDCTHPWNVSQLNKIVKVYTNTHSVATTSSVNRKSTSDHTQQVMTQLNVGYVRNRETIYCIPYSIHILYKPGNSLRKSFKMPSIINFGTKINNWWWKKLHKFVLKVVHFHSKL